MFTEASPLDRNSAGNRSGSSASAAAAAEGDLCSHHAAPTRNQDPVLHHCFHRSDAESQRCPTNPGVCTDTDTAAAHTSTQVKGALMRFSCFSLLPGCKDPPNSSAAANRGQYPTDRVLITAGRPTVWLELWCSLLLRCKGQNRSFHEVQKWVSSSLETLCNICQIKQVLNPIIDHVGAPKIKALTIWRKVGREAAGTPTLMKTSLKSPLIPRRTFK